MTILVLAGFAALLWGLNAAVKSLGSDAGNLLTGIPPRGLFGYKLEYDRIAQTGVAGTGIVLWVSPIATRAPRDGVRRFQTRRVVIDIEVPGVPSQELDTSPIIPSRLVPDILPGATLEIRVDPRNPYNIAIIGPGAGIAATSLIAGGASS